MSATLFRLPIADDGYGRDWGIGSEKPEFLSAGCAFEAMKVKNETLCRWRSRRWFVRSIRMTEKRADRAFTRQVAGEGARCTLGVRRARGKVQGHRGQLAGDFANWCDLKHSVFRACPRHVSRERDQHGIAATHGS